jgi:hypothetical protein
MLLWHLVDQVHNLYWVVALQAEAGGAGEEAAAVGAAAAAAG